MNASKRCAACGLPGGRDDIIASVLVLNWNGGAMVLACLTSVFAVSCEHVEVILVDNASGDGSPTQAKELFPSLTVVAHPMNLGVSEAYNAAVGCARGRFLAFLNSDTVVTQGWLLPLLDLLQQDGSVGIACPLLLSSQLGWVDSAGGDLTLWLGAFDRGFGLSRQSVGSTPSATVFYASGAAMAISKDLFGRLGGFDQELPMYGEDVDLSWRAGLIGFDVRCASTSVVYHGRSMSAGLINPDKVGIVTQHHIECMAKCLSIWHLLHSIPAYMAFAAAKATWMSVQMGSPSYGVAVAKAFVRALGRWRSIRTRRSDVQLSRRVSDSALFRSAGVRLAIRPRDVWRVGRSTRQLAVHRQLVMTGKDVTRQPTPAGQGVQ